MAKANTAAKAAKALEAQAKAQEQAERLYRQALADEAKAQAAVDAARQALGQARDVRKALAANFPHLKRLARKDGPVDVRKDAPTRKPKRASDEDILAALAPEPVRNAGEGVRSVYVKGARAQIAGKALTDCPMVVDWKIEAWKAGFQASADTQTEALQA